MQHPETVWNLLTDINNWPKSNPKVKNVNFDGKLTIGNTFKWKAGPGSITSTFQEINPPKRIVWIGKTLGIKGKHVWTLKPQDNKTVVTSQESWEGVIVSIIHGRLQKNIRRRNRICITIHENRNRTITLKFLYFF